jgi:hypothetical protein
MSWSEQAKSFFDSKFEPKEVKEAREIERIESARRLEKLGTKAFLEGQITPGDYQLLNELTSPITRLDLRKLAQDIKRFH